MNEFLGKDLHHYFTWVPTSIGGFVHRSRSILQTNFDNDMEIGGNQVYGGAIVTLMARIEKELYKNPGQPWMGIEAFYAKEEFKNFFKIRHCFAHSGGTVLPNRENEIKEFLKKLEIGKILDHENKPVPAYFSISDQNLIVLKRNSLTRLSSLCKELLAINGMIEKSKVHLKTNW